VLADATASMAFAGPGGICESSTKPRGTDFTQPRVKPTDAAFKKRIRTSCGTFLARMV
jgi:hypothetical protein